jgi:hypothetical protein
MRASEHRRIVLAHENSAAGFGYDLGMAKKSCIDPQRIREAIAIAAARLVAEDGLDYAGAKRRAAKQVAGDVRIGSEWLPDNDQLEAEIRAYQAIFHSDFQPALLRILREIALEWMQRLDAFHPFLTGAVLNGTAGEHSDIHLQLFNDSAKDVAIFLLNAGIQYEVHETRHFAGRGMVETLSILVRDKRVDARLGIHLALYDSNDLRGALAGNPRGRPSRVAAPAVAILLAENSATQPL